MLIRAVEILGAGSATCDVRLAGGRIAALGVDLVPLEKEPVVDGGGGALLPGLHDHHIHLLALSAALRSVRCGPPVVYDEAALASALRRAEPGADHWIRGVGYHESVAGELDADRLEGLATDHPVRIQHRSGALWIVSHAGLDRLGLAGRVPADAPEGVERTADGRATGRLYRVDDWLRERIGDRAPLTLGETGALLARVGVTGVTDATPRNDGPELALLSRAVAAGELPQRIRLMGTPSLPEPEQPGLVRGAVKLVLDENQLPVLGAFQDVIQRAHRDGRPVAVHCVTRVELAFAIAAFEAAGPETGDRIEHASIAPPDLTAHLARLGLCVVTQPNFIRERGDAYGCDVDAVDRPWLYRCRGLLEAGVALGGGTDAPFGEPDPWLAMQAALDRRTAAGVSLGESEALDPERALALFTTPGEAPGGTPRRIAVAEAADLCLLDRSWSRARDALDGAHVVATWVGGKLVWHRESNA